jgi:hypothetical protein
MTITFDSQLFQVLVASDVPPTLPHFEYKGLQAAPTDTIFTTQFLQLHEVIPYDINR